MHGKAMRISLSLVTCALSLGYGCALAAATASAQHYPSRPIRVIAPFAPGGGSDVVARFVAAHLAERVGQPVVVDNRPAASGVVGTDLVAKAVPDGYTLLTTTVTFVISSTLQKRLPYDGLKDFTPITIMVSTPVGLLLHPSVPAKTVKEFIAYAKANPGKLNYGSSGAGSATHLMAELFSSMAGIQMNHVPYKGVSAYTTAQVANEIQVSFGNLFSTQGLWKSGRLRAIAHGGLKRSEAFPEIPTIAEAGVPGYEASLWYGFMAPAKTPRPVVQKLYTEITAVVTAPEARKTFVSQGNEVIAATPAEFAKVIQTDAAKWGGIGKRLGISMN